MAEIRYNSSSLMQPIGWNSNRYQHCFKTVMPPTDRGATMTILKTTKSGVYNEVSHTGHFLPPMASSSEERPAQSHKFVQKSSSRPAENSLFSHMNLRPLSAYSTDITLKPHPRTTWLTNHQLNTHKLKALMRDNAYIPGNFSTLFSSTKQNIEEMVGRLSYDPYSRREKKFAKPVEDGKPMQVFTQKEIDDLVNRLYVTHNYSEEHVKPVKSVVKKELSLKEKEIVERLTKYEPKHHSTSKEQKEIKKTITKAQLDEMLNRLTRIPEENKVEITNSISSKKVTLSEMENILSRLMTFDSQKWPPESKPHIFKNKN